jgi:hypothetical protein
MDKSDLYEIIKTGKEIKGTALGRLIEALGGNSNNLIKEGDGKVFFSPVETGIDVELYVFNYPSKLNLTSEEWKKMEEPVHLKGIIKYAQSMGASD